MHCSISSASFGGEEVEGVGLHPHRRRCPHHLHPHPAESSSCLRRSASCGTGISSREHNLHPNLLPRQAGQR